jgi:putative peptidoglycan lipid II flippase
MRPTLRANLVVSSGTALSRITGFARFAVFGIVFGRTALWDAYNAANNSPNMIYELLLGGVLSATLVPVFTRYFEQKDDESISAVVTTASLAAVGLTAIAVLAAPLIFHLTAINVSDQVDAGDYRSLGSSLARIFLIQVFFYTLSALWGALLQAKRRFFAPSWAPVLSNLAIIASLLIANAQLGEGEDGFAAAINNSAFRNTLAVGATIGISLQAFALLPALRRADVRLHFRPNFGHAGARAVFRLSGWTLGFALSNVAAAQVIQNLARPGSGNAAAYTLAFTFFLLPHALLAMSILTTWVPDLATFVTRGDRRGFTASFSRGAALIVIITIPAGFGLFVLREPIIGALFQHGEFGRDDTIVTANALAGFSLGLGGFSLYQFALRGFYSHHDTRTPFVINLLESILNVVLAVVLVALLSDETELIGLGAAFAASYVVCSVWSLRILNRKVRGLRERNIVALAIKATLASVVMAEAIWYLNHAIGSNDGFGAWLRIFVGMIVGAAIYLVLLLALATDDLTYMLRRSVRRPA